MVAYHILWCHNSNKEQNKNVKHVELFYTLFDLLQLSSNPRSTVLYDVRSESYEVKFN